MSAARRIAHKVAETARGNRVRRSFSSRPLRCPCCDPSKRCDGAMVPPRYNRQSVAAVFRITLVSAISVMIVFPRSSNRIFRATTVGVQEKCIDIALAVEMMHYATIPDTYDVGGERER